MRKEQLELTQNTDISLIKLGQECPLCGLPSIDGSCHKKCMDYESFMQQRDIK